MGVLRIREERGEKRMYMGLLLLGDECADMIDRYLDRGILFVGETAEGPVAVCVVTHESSGVVEIKNLAVDVRYQGRGYGTAMMKDVERRFSGYELLVGTGETPSTLAFYRKLGFSDSHRVPDFFTDNYPMPIVEEGVLLRDMIYLRKVACVSGG